MRICLIASPREPYARLTELLSRDHEVTLIGGDEVKPIAEMERASYAGVSHRFSAAAMEAIRAAYPQSGPDFVEVSDRRALGLVPMIARRCADPLLAETRFAVRLFGTTELTGLHNGFSGDAQSRLLGDLEREQLRLADRLFHAGGDAADLYHRYYGNHLPDAFEAGLPGLPAEPVSRCPAPGGELRILYNGELSRGGGALDLASACLRLPVDGWSLTMVGHDTETGPAGQSVRLTIEAMFNLDPRLRIASPEEVGDLEWGRFDLAAVTPTFAVWSEPASEALRHGLPLLATPVGQLSSLVEPGVTGWLTEGTGSGAIRDGLLRLLETPEQVPGLGGPLAVAARYEELADAERVREGYERVLELEAVTRPQSPRRRLTSRSQPLVSGVVPYHGAAAYIGEAVQSLLEQTHPELEVVIVNDGSFEPADELLEGLAANPRVRVVTQMNRGETAARNLGVRMARGEYVVMLDADNVLESEFVARALTVFEQEPDLAYVSCWLRFIGADGSEHREPSGYAPLGNGVVRDDVDNWDGDTLALLPRRLFTELGLSFDEPSIVYSDWEFYRRLREAGRYGVVIPEWLARYRVLGSSLQRAHSLEMQRRGWNEAQARQVLRATRWTAGGDGH
jgi:glycogen(starch) synthase